MRLISNCGTDRGLDLIESLLQPQFLLDTITTHAHRGKSGGINDSEVMAYVVAPPSEEAAG